ncbi:transcriptional regulator [bacterium]|nr:MAG: transcriptional regulator [bacterium]
MSDDKKKTTCPAAIALEAIRGRWKLLILQQLYVRVNRFGELRRALDGISEKVLVQQLRELERDGIIQRKIYTQVPPKVEYSLTPLGRNLRPIVEGLHEWGMRYLSENG